MQVGCDVDYTLEGQQNCHENLLVLENQKKRWGVYHLPREQLASEQHAWGSEHLYHLPREQLPREQHAWGSEH